MPGWSAPVYRGRRAGNACWQAVCRAQSRALLQWHVLRHPPRRAAGAEARPDGWLCAGEPCDARGRADHRQQAEQAIFVQRGLRRKLVRGGWSAGQPLSAVFTRGGGWNHFELRAQGRRHGAWAGGYGHRRGSLPRGEPHAAELRAYAHARDGRAEDAL